MIIPSRPLCLVKKKSRKMLRNDCPQDIYYIKKMCSKMNESKSLNYLKEK